MTVLKTLFSSAFYCQAVCIIEIAGVRPLAVDCGHREQGGGKKIGGGGGGC